MKVHSIGMKTVEVRSHLAVTDISDKGTTQRFHGFQNGFIYMCMN